VSVWVRKIARVAIKKKPNKQTNININIYMYILQSPIVQKVDNLTAKLEVGCLKGYCQSFCSNWEKMKKLS
jgi:hypothetical protein